MIQLNISRVEQAVETGVTSWRGRKEMREKEKSEKERKERRSRTV